MCTHRKPSQARKFYCICKCITIHHPQAKYMSVQPLCLNAIYFHIKLTFGTATYAFHIKSIRLKICRKLLLSIGYDTATDSSNGTTMNRWCRFGIFMMSIRFFYIRITNDCSYSHFWCRN